MNGGAVDQVSDCGTINYAQTCFVKSVHALSQLPEPEYPEVAFAGRSNVGKSSLMNRLIKRKSLVKVSARPGKTQSLNFFLVDNALYFVDLPGYGFARVSRGLQDAWQQLVTAYLGSRRTLRCVVVVIDLRHPLKKSDQQLVGWLRANNIPYLPVYTKKDKLSRNQQVNRARALDAGLGASPDERLVFSSKTGEGREELLKMLDRFVC